MGDSQGLAAIAALRREEKLLVNCGMALNQIERELWNIITVASRSSALSNPEKQNAAALEQLKKWHRQCLSYLDNIAKLMSEKLDAVTIDELRPRRKQQVKFGQGLESVIDDILSLLKKYITRLEEIISSQKQQAAEADEAQSNNSNNISLQWTEEDTTAWEYVNAKMEQIPPLLEEDQEAIRIEMKRQQAAHEQMLRTPPSASRSPLSPSAASSSGTPSTPQTPGKSLSESLGDSCCIQ